MEKQNFSNSSTFLSSEPDENCAKLTPELAVELPNKTAVTTSSDSEANSKTVANEAIQPDKIVELETQPVTIHTMNSDKKSLTAAELIPTNTKSENSTSDEPLQKRAKYYLVQDGNVNETSYELCFNPDQTVDEIDPTTSNNSDNSTILNYLEKIDSRLDSLDRRMERFGKELRQIKKKCNQTEEASTVELYEIYSNLPLKSELDVEFLEKELSQNKGKYLALLKYLKKIKESSHHSQYVRKCLYSIFDDNITTCYNWSGKGDKNKKAVSDLIIMRIIHEAVESCFENVAKRTTELVMMRWFRYGPQRLSRNKDHKQEDDEFLQVITFID